MCCTLKTYALGVCLFVFLFVIIGGALHLGPGGALLGTTSGTPLVIFAYNRWHSAHLETKAPGSEDSTGLALRVPNRL